MSLPDRTMGDMLCSSYDTIRLSWRMTRLQTQWIELDNTLQQTTAFSFAIFAMYISLISLLATLVTGLLH